MLKILLIVLLTYVTFGSGGVLTSPAIELGCSIPIGSQTDWKIFWPLAFRLNGTLYSTQDDIGELEVWIPLNEKFIVSCGPNYLSGYPRQSQLTVKCAENNKFLTETKELKVAKDFKCDLRAIEEIVVPTVAGCLSGATTGQFGYIHPMDNLPRIVGESCYNKEEGKTLFAHLHYGNKQNPLLEEILDENFFKNQEYPDSRYKTDFMKLFRLDQFNERLEKLLGYKEIPGYQMANYIDTNLLWNKQLLATKKLVWNYFPIHDDVAETFELLKKDISNLVADNMDIYVGSHGVAKLKNSEGEKVPIYLDSEEKMYPIPELIWVVVVKREKAVVFGIFNNPNLSEKELNKISPCQRSKCEKISWLENLEKSGLTGKPELLMCCDHNELKNSMQEIPKFMHVSQLYV